jgi:hypothetical protein
LFAKNRQREEAAKRGSEKGGEKRGRKIVRRYKTKTHSKLDGDTSQRR